MQYSIAAQPKKQTKTDAELSEPRCIFGSKCLVFWKNYTLTKKVMGSVFRPFAFFAYGSAKSVTTQILATKSCRKKITKQKAKKRATTKSPKKRKKIAKSQKNVQIRNANAAALDMCQNSCFSQFCHQ